MRVTPPLSRAFNFFCNCTRLWFYTFCNLLIVNLFMAAGSVINLHVSLFVVLSRNNNIINPNHQQTILSSTATIFIQPLLQGAFPSFRCFTNIIVVLYWFVFGNIDILNNMECCSWNVITLHIRLLMNNSVFDNTEVDE